LQILSEYFTECGKSDFPDKYNPEIVVRCYTSYFVTKNIEYFLDRFKYVECREEDYNESNPRSETSDILSLDLFQDNNEIVTSTYQYIDDDDETTVEEEEDDESLPPLINIIEDEDNDDDLGDELYETGIFVSQDEFNAKNKNEECVICWNIVMNHYNSMKWKNCDHFTCIYCHDECMAKRLHKCPLCRM
jgi:hypothetical protein